MPSFGTMLKDLRNKAGLTQAELAERAGINRVSVANLERGDAVPAWPTVQALAKALGVDCTAFQAVEVQAPAKPPRKRKKKP